MVHFTGVLEETERQQILKALKECNWVVAAQTGRGTSFNETIDTLPVEIKSSDTAVLHSRAAILWTPLLKCSPLHAVFRVPETWQFTILLALVGVATMP